MPTTNYYSVNGQIIAEKTAGSSRVDYLTDALGSVTATVDQSANVVNTYRYKPYGAQLAKTGAGSDPAFRWVGSQGYRQTGKQFSDVYIRARHYSSELGRWTTKDPIRFRNRYTYGRSRPTATIDPSGLFAIKAQALVGHCELLHFYVSWVLPPGTEPSGYVVQHLIWEQDVVDCSPPFIPSLPPFRQKFKRDYWEAWWFDGEGILRPSVILPVVNCGNGGSALCHDYFAPAGAAIFTARTFGKVSFTGYVKFMKNYQLSAIDQWVRSFYYTLGNYRIYYTDVPSRLGRSIVGWNDLQYGTAQLHTLVASWDCCKEQRIELVTTIPGCIRS